MMVLAAAVLLLAVTLARGMVRVRQALDVELRRHEEEEAFWAELRVQALDGYGRVFDWAEECEEFGCHEDQP